MNTEQQNPMEAMANKACRQCTRIMNRCCTNGVCHWWCVDCRIRVDVPKEQKPMSVDECSAWNGHLATDWKLDEERVETFTSGYRAGCTDTEAKVREEIAGQMLALAEKWKKCWGPELHSFELEQLATPEHRQKEGK